MSELTSYQMFIDGAWDAGTTGRRMQSVNPYTGQVWADFPEGDETDVDRAVRAARRAFEETDWTRRPRYRAEVLRKLADLIERDAERFAQLESTDNGKTISEERRMYESLPAFYRLAASYAETMSGDVPTGANPDVLSMTMYEPYGVIGIQTPWNTPGVIFGQAAAPALATGNAVVVKPSELAPCSTLEFGRLALEAGLPDGLVNIVTGPGPAVGAALCAHPGVDKLVFTGSPAAGRMVAAAGASRLAPVLLELGGKSANIVFPDADLDAAVEGLVRGFTASAGQTCVCGSRALIHESIYAEVVERMIKAVGELRVGDPADPATELGPVFSRQQFDHIDELVRSSVEEGADIACGGGLIEGCTGNFYAPTIVTNAHNQMRIAQEEVFGPVVVCIPFRTEEEAIRIANGTAFGLAAGVWTADLNRAHRMTRDLRSGKVWVNHYRAGDANFPFGGIGESGYGRVNGMDGIREMTRSKSVQILLDQNRA
ncbi:acyl-CoA reductase-like NAD-dependent aldehyde dehydrogenase [Nocardioides sp. J9]|uniref:aldehyde dehydrogenase family protein n=1 Tax=Nocardioides sp. J9 TaxID=935844 RepID=UPI0011ADF856|nr:aldehyde dehydrogenase family protein [Nocardioides sp. J9]TWG98581.1 acyl-CoA reductase-like NAD-dependent aldehyde dehydrogenase [Nocardioides sp. J9]